MYSALDLKSGFENVVLDPAMTRFCGIVMQDGLYVLKRMTFGFHTVPAYFQAIMMTVMDAEPNRPTNITYIDDITVAAYQVPVCWWETLETIWSMLRTGSRSMHWSCSCSSVTSTSWGCFCATAGSNWATRPLASSLEQRCFEATRI